MLVSYLRNGQKVEGVWFHSTASCTAEFRDEIQRQFSRITSEEIELNTRYSKSKESSSRYSKHRKTLLQSGNNSIKSNSIPTAIFSCNSVLIPTSTGINAETLTQSSKQTIPRKVDDCIGGKKKRRARLWAARKKAHSRGCNAAKDKWIKGIR